MKKRISTLAAIGLLAVFAATPFAESLWNKAATHENLFADKKARDVGDIVTIVIVESAQASDSTESNIEKDHGVELGFGLLFDRGGDQDAYAKEAHGSINAANDFASAGDHARQSRITAQISAIVRAVQPNGNLVIEGRRAIYLDEEKKNIILTGVVRPEDISSNNTVESNAIADAQIIYEGFGPISDSTKPGLLSSILRWIPLF